MSVGLGGSNSCNNKGIIDISTKKNNDVMIKKEGSGNSGGLIDSLKEFIASYPLLAKYSHSLFDKEEDNGSSNNSSSSSPSALLSNGSQFQTVGQFWTMWRAINWLSTHSRYMPLSYVLAEYVTKTALSYMPPEKAKHYSMLLCMCGFDVKNVNLGVVGQTVYKIATTGARVDELALASLQPHNSVPPSHMMDAIRRMITHIFFLNGLPSVLSQDAHVGFANFLFKYASITDITPKVFAEAADYYYGKAKAWLQSGFSIFLNGGGEWAHSNRQALHTRLAAAYNELINFVRRAFPMIAAANDTNKLGEQRLLATEGFI